MGIASTKIEEGIANLQAVPGRFERIDEGQPFLVVVDYAHTDDALKNVLKTAREITRDRLIVLFGCGGERDRTKRPRMGEAAGTLADFVVLTSDNPRSEDPLLIMADALVGLQRTGKPYIAEVDRGIAIRKALEEAREGDVVVLAGKGHETYQILKDGKIDFDDRDVAREVLAEMGYGSNSRLSIDDCRLTAFSSSVDNRSKLIAAIGNRQSTSFDHEINSWGGCGTFRNIIRRS